MANKFWSRSELVALLGSPLNEWATAAEVSDVHGAQEITGVHVDWDADGAVRVMQWQCNASAGDAQQLESSIRSLHDKPAPNESEISAAFDAAADFCLAASRVANEKEGWVLLRVCSRHRATGLKAADPFRI
jgi:hypothetical protein